MYCTDIPAICKCQHWCNVGRERRYDRKSQRIPGHWYPHDFFRRTKVESGRIIMKFEQRMNCILTDCTADSTTTLANWYPFWGITNPTNVVVDSIGFCMCLFDKDLDKSIHRYDYPSNLIDSIHKFNTTFSASQQWDWEVTRYCQVSEEAMYVIITISESGWVKIDFIESSESKVPIKLAIETTQQMLINWCTSFQIQPLPDQSLVIHPSIYSNTNSMKCQYREDQSDFIGLTK